MTISRLIGRTDTEGWKDGEVRKGGLKKKGKLKKKEKRIKKTKVWGGKNGRKTKPNSFLLDVLPCGGDE